MYGPLIKAFEARAKKTGVTPAPLLNRPRLKAPDAPYQEAFNSLNNSRQGGMGGPCAIPISEVLAYLNLMGIASIAQRSKYLRLLQQMDSTYLTYVAEKQAASTPDHGR